MLSIPAHFTVSNEPQGTLRCNVAPTPTAQPKSTAGQIITGFVFSERVLLPIDTYGAYGNMYLQHTHCTYSATWTAFA
jgi:hypothetical protein